MKTAIPVILFALLACAGSTAGAKQARVIIECSASHDDCIKKSTKREAPVLPPDQPGVAEMGPMAGPMVAAPPSLAAHAMPPGPSAPATSVVAPEIPAAAHAACARRKNGSKMTVKVGAEQTLTGTCKKEDGKMRFKMRNFQNNS